MLKLKKLARCLCAALLIGAAVSVSGCSEKTSVVAYYNADRIWNEAGQIKAIHEEGAQKFQEKRTELESKLKEKQTELETKYKDKQAELEARLKAKEDEFNQKVQENPPTSQEEADRIQAEADELGQSLQQEAETEMKKLQDEASAEAQRIQQEAGLQLQGIQGQYQSKMERTLKEALAEITKAKKIDVVLDNSVMQKSVIYGGVDITEDLLEKLK